MGHHSASDARGTKVKAWMKNHVTTVDADMSLMEAEAVLLSSDIGCMPVVSGTDVVGMLTRTDLLRQHHYYTDLHYHNPAFADNLKARKPIVELRKKLKQFENDDD